MNQGEVAMRCVSYGLTDVGLKRSHNEDNYVCDDELGLYVVADGMGGHAAGEVASNSAIQTIYEFVRKYLDDGEIEWPLGYEDNHDELENVLRTAMQLANNTVCELAHTNQAYSGMGTTIAGLLIKDGKAAVGHVGDSRVYRMRNMEFDQVTLDHSWVNEQLRRNIITEEEARSHRWRNVITRALGNTMDVEVELTPVDLKSGDLYFICSDGLSGMVSDEEIQQVLSENGTDLEQTCKKLVLKANSNGGMDNITAVLVRVDEK